MNTARALLVILVAAVVGIAGYQIGIAQNVTAALPPGAAPVPYYGYPYWGFGFGFGHFFGFLFTIFFIFLFFGLLRAAFWGGRGWGHRHGYGRGPWSDDARARIDELHRELHGEKPDSGGAAGQSSRTT